jgi:cytochrome c oxidase assembly protein subunit 15
MATHSQRPIVHWLYFCAALVWIMVAIGGLTRLTDSGLSMVDWKPITGWLPPMSQEAWEAELDNYRSSPEYQKVNKGMSVAEFKQIFWLEYIHRVFGRIIGIAFFVPFAWFVYTKQLMGKRTLQLGGIFLLGGLQALMGWIMVQSGLVDTPRVAPIKLTAHLSLATIIFGLILWMAWNLCPKSPRIETSKPLRRFSILVTVAIFIQIMLGGLVAGNDAGLVFNTYPLMDGAYIPPDLYFMDPWYANIIEDVKTVQWHHRLMALLLAIMIPLYVFQLLKHKNNQKLKIYCTALLFIFILQYTFGVLTLIHVVPIALASLHQLVAIILIGVSLKLNHCLLGKREHDKTERNEGNKQ